ncbi:hypothetical protein C9F11_10290 [Streptomyces sp. YIM 121038]|nr:hypothetical protein C9F11_10290 [Streptomyces sp. YIM 121038]
MKTAPKYNHATLRAMLQGKRASESVGLSYADRAGEMHFGVLISMGSKVSVRAEGCLVEDIPLGHIHEALVIPAVPTSRKGR